MRPIYIATICIGSMLIIGCSRKMDFRAMENFSGNQLVQWNYDLTKVVITDVLTPPVCSRVYAYTNISAYEALRPAYPQYPTFAGKLNGLTAIPEPEGNKGDYYFPVSSIIAFSTVAQKMVFNSDAIRDMENMYLLKLDGLHIKKELLDKSIAYGRAVGQHVIEWAARDGYLQRNSHPGYIVNKDRARWQPTPPDYMDAIEPNWSTLRPFTLDSASQFRPVDPPEFDTLSGSPYFKAVMQVYNAVNSINKEFLAIAKFWDCNPNISVTQGHVMYFQQKISPGGHWICLTSSICAKEKYNKMKTAEIISKVSIAAADAFISCWEAKYHYNSVRPETVINKFIDKDWRPILQTPPFPEYPSGHSVVSGAASTMLTHLISDHYTYLDSMEVPFGIAPRKFKSFNDAASEASVSRMYGGIHYMPALNNGLEEGRKIGRFILRRL